ncbi:MAG: hypothetical protein JWO05_1148 [Gemmatimonadetes bacterium]|nr:hypothetical protein [Gemmatimonadota bacterium]
MPAKDKVFRMIGKVIMHRDDVATAATALTAGAAAAATSITVASIAGLSNGDTIRVGSGEDVELNKISGAPSGFVVTLAYPLAKAHVIGEAAKRQISYDHGDPTDGGVTVSIEADNIDVPVATRRVVLSRIDGFARAFVEWAWPTITLPNVAAALGLLVAKVTGSGTTASPFQLITDGSDFGEDTNISVTVVGTLVDGTTMTVELHGVDMDHSVVKAALTRGALATIPAKGKAASQVAFLTSDPGYTLNTSLKPSKNSVWDAPSEVGIYAPAGGGGTSTLSAAAAAGATAIVLVSATNFAAGDRVKVNTGDLAEMHIVDNVAVNTLNLRGKLLRAQAIGVTAVEQLQTPFGGLSEEGVSIEVTGDKRDIKLATKRFEAGSVPGNAAISLMFSVIDFVLANIAYALAIPQSAISGGRLVAGNNIGTGDQTEFYTRGLTAGGNTIEIDACGCSQVIEQFSVALSNKDIVKLPIKALPASCLIMRQY